MPTANHSITYNAVLAAGTSAEIGNAMVPNASGVWVVATTANRASFGRARGIAISAYSGTSTGTIHIQHDGVIPAATLGLLTGSAVSVRVDANGDLERVATPSGSDDVIGHVNAYGLLNVQPLTTITATATLPLSAANGGTGLSSLGSGVATWLGTPSSANLAAALTDETGSGAAVFGTGPTLSAPVLASTPTLSGSSSSTTNDTKGTATDVNPVNLQTTDATVSSLETFSFTTSDAGLVVSALVNAIKSDGSEVAAYSLAAVFKNDSGTVTQVGTTTKTVIGESDAAWDATIDNSTTTIRIRVTGKAATTIRWSCVYTRLQVIP